MLALVDVAGAETEPAWHTGDIPAEHAIRGFHGLLEDASPPDEKLLAMGEVPTRRAPESKEMGHLSRGRG